MSLYMRQVVLCEVRAATEETNEEGNIKYIVIDYKHLRHFYDYETQFWSMVNLLTTRMTRRNMICFAQSRYKWVPVVTAWRVLRLRREERPPIWRLAVNILSRQSRTVDKGWSSSLGFGRGASNSSSWNVTCYEMFSKKTSDRSGQGQLADTCECRNEPSGSIKCGEFLD